MDKKKLMGRSLDQVLNDLPQERQKCIRAERERLMATVVYNRVLNATTVLGVVCFFVIFGGLALSLLTERF